MLTSLSFPDGCNAAYAIVLHPRRFVVDFVGQGRSTSRASALRTVFVRASRKASSADAP
jgi:hypothetical protein